WGVEVGFVTSSCPGDGRGPASGGSQRDPGLRRGTTEERAALATLAERAARLAKADLVTGMVGEFPELQGLMGGYYAAAQGEHPQVAAAIRDHYKPVGQGDEVPTAPVTVAVSVADKLDTLVAFFIGAEQPTGSKDPYALRRSALGLIATVLDNQLRLSIRIAIFAAYWEFRKTIVNRLHRDKFLEFLAGSKGLPSEPRADIIQHIERSRQTRLAEADESELKAIFWNVKALENFFADRLKVQQREAGVRHDLIDAVFALGGEDDLVRLLARVHALQAFIATEDGANLLAGYKRAANILKKEGWDDAQHDNAPAQKSLSYTPEHAEAALIAALESAAPAAARAVEQEDFEAAMTALASLRPPIDAFFEQVTVNDADPAKRDARLALLARVRDAVHAVADFSKIEG
ncbi:MAG: glycine--tRNA ligase subunit beta, partial [Sphingomonas sp.]